MRRRVVVILVSFLASCSAVIDETPVPDALTVGSIERVFVSTNRAMEQDGSFGTGRSQSLSFLDVAVSVPPDRRVGDVTTGGERKNPEKDFVFARRDVLPSGNEFASELRTALSARAPGHREVTVFVHGYNNGFSEAVFRAAQLKYDLGLPGEMIAFAWPSRGSAFGYEYDKDSVLEARDSLERLLITLDRAGIGDIVLVGHSMGAFLVMETLRQIELKNPRWVARTLSGVALVSPDIDVDVFRSQARQITPLPQPFLIFSSTEDRVLRVAARLTGQPARLGNLSNVSDLQNFPVTVIDVTAFSDDSATSHFVAGSSPALIAMIGQARNMDPNFLHGESGISILLPGANQSASTATRVVLEPGR